MEPGRGRRQADHRTCRRWCARWPRRSSKVDKITIVSTGDGDAAGAHKITGDMAEMAAQVPALFEALSGMKM